MIDKLLLFPYYLALKTRHALYNKGIKKSRPGALPTVCVGNIAAGGTGKTPHTEMILRALLRSDDWGMREIAVLSRGYKRSSRGFQQISSSDGASFAGDEQALAYIDEAIDSARTALDELGLGELLDEAGTEGVS